MRKKKKKKGYSGLLDLVNKTKVDMEDLDKKKKENKKSEPGSTLFDTYDDRVKEIIDRLKKINITRQILSSKADPSRPETLSSFSNKKESEDTNITGEISNDMFSSNAPVDLYSNTGNTNNDLLPGMSAINYALPSDLGSEM